MRVLTISDTDDTGEDEAEPLLVVQVDGPMIRRILALVIDELAAEPGGRVLRLARPKPDGA